jgi:hypothetical protein
MFKKMDAKIEVNRKMIGKVVFIVSLELTGTIEDVKDAETFIINILGEKREIDIFDIRTL